jgi:hypothetical protein
LFIKVLFERPLPGGLFCGNLIVLRTILFWKHKINLEAAFKTEFSYGGEGMGFPGKKQCFFCDLMNCSGITVLKYFICCDCQREIVHTCDEIKYRYYCLKIKRIWEENLSLS